MWCLLGCFTRGVEKAFAKGFVWSERTFGDVGTFRYVLQLWKSKKWPDVKANYIAECNFIFSVSKGSVTTYLCLVSSDQDISDMPLFEFSLSPLRFSLIPAPGDTRVSPNWLIDWRAMNDETTRRKCCSTPTFFGRTNAIFQSLLAQAVLWIKLKGIWKTLT